MAFYDGGHANGYEKFSIECLDKYGIWNANVQRNDDYKK